MRRVRASSLPILWVGSCLAAPVNAGIIFESAPPGQAGLTIADVGNGGAVLVSSGVLLGMPFEIGATTQVSAAGAYLIGLSSDPMFAAIVPLANGSALPSGEPFDSSTIAYSLFTPGSTSGDYFAAFDLTLQPGWYGLVIGAGYFGSPSTAGGLLVKDGSGSPPPMFGWDSLIFNPPAIPAAWSRYGGSDDFRMFVEGTPEPRPAVISFLGLVAMWAGMRLCRRVIAQSGI